MSIYNNLTKQFRDAYLNCFLPSDETLIESVKTHLGLDSEVIEHTEEHLILMANFDNDKISFKFNFRLSSIGRLCVSDITLHNVSE